MFEQTLTPPAEPATLSWANGRSPQDIVRARRMARTRFQISLLPFIALTALTLLATLPFMTVHSVVAASPERFSTVTVRPGQTVWEIAVRRTGDGADVQDTVDRIIAANHLRGAHVIPGQQLKVPE
jgi:LysM repeat protein